MKMIEIQRKEIHEWNERVEKADWKWFVIIGGLNYFVSLFMIQVAISLNGASMASLLNSMTAVAVTILAIILLGEKLTPPVTINATAVIVLIYLGIVGSGLAQFTWTKSLSLLPAVTCSLFYPLQPVFTTIMGALFLGEHVTVSFLIGLVLISLDIVINIFATSKEK